MQGQLPAPTAEGSLAKTPFPHLLVYSLERRLSGSFELRLGDTVVATMLVIGGCPAKVRIQEPLHHLGVVLNELGMITTEQLQASLDQMQAAPRLLGEILVEMGAITPALLEAGLRSQVERKVEHLFTLSTETTFAYYDSADLLQTYGGPPTPIDAFPVMWRGVRGSPSWEHVDATIQRVSPGFIRPSAIAQFERFAFGPQELEAIEKLRQRPVRVQEITAVLEPGVGQVLVYLLTIMKQLDLVEAPAAPQPPQPMVPPAPSTPVIARPASLVSPPSSGQAFARVQLQQRQATRPLVVEEHVAPSTGDGRISNTGMPAQVVPVAAPKPKAGGAFASATPEVPSEPAIRDPMPTPAPADIGSMIHQTISSSVPPPMEDSAEASPPEAADAAVSDAPADGKTALSPEQEALKAKIVARAEEINSQDYFQMLGMPRDAPAEAIQKAFIGLAKVWHPDRLPPALVDVKDACSKVFTHLTEAHATLTDPVRRQDYMTLLKDGGATPDDQAKIQAILEAATEFQKAEILLKRNQNDPQAYEIVRRCVSLDDGQVDYVATLAWLDSQRPEWQGREKTLEKVLILDRCIQKNPNCERAYFYRAMLHKRVDMGSKALKDFKKAAELNPRNLDAMREVRLHNMRGGVSKPPPGGGPADRTSKAPPAKDKGGGGLFGKLFKK